MNISENEFLNKIIFGKYKILKLEGNGAFSAVFSAKNVINNQLVALKVQKKMYNIGILEKEAFYLYRLKGIGIPKIISYGNYGNYNILVEELLGKTIEELFKQNINKSNIIRLKDLAMSGIQIIDRIQFIHSKYILHLDIKPSNFLFGKDDNSLIYIIDFGMARKYRSSRTKKHIKFSKNNYFAGNIKYSSINTMKGVQPSRRDDLESLGYMIIYLYNQQLPWENLKCKNHSDLAQKIFAVKSFLSIKMLCKDLPKEMNEYMIYVKSLKFEEEPNYIYITRIFELMLKKINKINDLNFSWIDKVLRNNNEKKLSQNNKRKKTSPFSKILQKINSKNEINEKDIESQAENNHRISSLNKEKLNFHESDLINIKNKKKIFSTESSAEKNKKINFTKINPNNNNKNKNYSRNLKVQRFSLRCSSKLNVNKNTNKNEFFSSSNSIRKNLILKTYINYHPLLRNSNRNSKAKLNPFMNNNENSKINKTKKNNINNNIRIRKKIPYMNHNNTNNFIIPFKYNELMHNFNEKTQDEIFLKNFTKDILRQNIMYKSKLV